MEFTVEEIKQILNAKIVGTKSRTIHHVIYDSRYPAFIDEAMFVALKGNRFDGHDFINDMYHVGVRVFMLQRQPEVIYDDATYIFVENTLLSLQQLAAEHRKKFSYPVVGITGSYGKSIIKEWLYDLLNEDFNIVRSPKSYNSQLGVALSVLQMSESNDLALFEAGISTTNEMQKLQYIIKPTIGIFTNIGIAHQEGFSSIEEKINEKLNLFETASTLIYPSKYDILEQKIKERYIKKNLVSWGYNNDDYYKIKEVLRYENYTDVALEVNFNSYTIRIPFVQQEYIENAITVFVAAHYLGGNLLKLSEKILKLTPIEMRLQMVEAINNCTLINDYYNSDLNSVSLALSFLQQQNRNKHKVVICSDIPHNQYREEEIYKTLSNWINENKISLFIGIGKEIEQCRKYLVVSSKFFDSVEQFLYELDHLSLYDATILLKGSRRFEFERISQRLQSYTHETVLQIDLNALLHNYRQYVSLLPENVKKVAMVKAFSYGSGLFEVAKLLQDQQVDYLAVAYVDEGIALRKHGIFVPIMVMSPELYALDQMVDYQLEPVLYNKRITDSFVKVIRRKGFSAYPVHIKVDTGMHRLGFCFSDKDYLCETLTKNSFIKVESLFTHLVASEDQNEDDFSELQIEKLLLWKKIIENCIQQNVLIHALNSAGIERFKQYAFDMVRIGIGLYGVSNAGVLKNKLLPVFSFKTKITQIKELDSGNTIGYNRKGKINRKSKIAVLPVGYADGLNRRLSNGNYSVRIKDKYVPIVGNICMDMCMIDITGVEAEEGDEVIIFETIEELERMARVLNTIPYEILTSISRRVKRIYYHD